MRYVSLHILTAVFALAQTPPAFPLESIRIRGNDTISTERIIAASGLKLGTPMRRDDFNAARDRLMATGAFTGVGFEFKASPAQTGYDATFEVREVGPLYRYRFEELPASEAALRDALRKQEPLFGDAIPAEPQVMNRYSVALASVLNVQVIGEVNNDLPGGPMILFRPLGERRVISQITFEGNTVLPSQELWRLINQTAIGTRYSEPLFRVMLDGTLRGAYEDRGRLRLAFPKIATERSKENEGLNLTVTVEEGPSYTLGDVTLAGVDASQVSELNKLGAWAKGEIADMSGVSAGVARIRKNFRQNGYLRVEGEIERTLHDDTKSVDLRVTIAPGPRFSMGKLTITGLDIISEPVIRKLWTLNPGAVYRESFPDDFVAKIQADGYFDNLQRIGVESFPHDDTRTVDVTLTFIGGRVTTEQERQRRGR